MNEKLDAHIEIHKNLHRNLDELVADFIAHTNKLPSETTIMELMTWAFEQIKNPTGGDDIVLKQWKGKSGNEIIKDGTFFTVVNYRKEKETGEVNKESHIVSIHKVNFVFNILMDLYNDGNDIISYRQVAKNIIDELGLTVGLDAFNGGRNRKIYFKEYYYPIKILEHFKIITYSGKGKITILDKNFKGFVGDYK